MNDGLYAFNKADKDALINMIGSEVTEFPEEWPTSGKGGGSRLVRFEMTGDWSSGAADSDFFEMDGTAIGADTLRDPESIFSELGEGDRGLAMLQGGMYWAVKGPSTVGRVVVFTLSDDFVGTTASADFAEVDGTPIGSGVLRDPTGIVGSSLTVGDKGLAYKKGSQYVFLNAHCDQEGE